MDVAHARGRSRVAYITCTHYERCPCFVPAGPEGDSALDLVQDPVKFAQAVSKQYGGVVGMQVSRGYRYPLGSRGGGPNPYLTRGACWHSWPATAWCS
jgi:hypothetical protein